MTSDGSDPWDGNNAVSLSADQASTRPGLGELKPYRVRLSITYDYLVLAHSPDEACSLETAAEAKKYEETAEQSDNPWQIRADETDLTMLPCGWDEDSYLYGAAEEISVGEVREMLTERESRSLGVGSRVYHRRMDLFGTIEAVITSPQIENRKDRRARVKYEYPMSADAEPREVRLGELIAAHKAERIG